MLPTFSDFNAGNFASDDSAAFEMSEPLNESRSSPASPAISAAPSSLMGQLVRSSSLKDFSPDNRAKPDPVTCVPLSRSARKPVSAARCASPASDTVV